MLLDKIDERALASLRKKANSSSSHFNPDQYDLHFQYDTASGTIMYVASRKDLSDDTIPLGYYFSIGSDLKIAHGDNFPWLPMVEYVREFEKKLTEDQQRQLYGEAYFTLGAAAGLSSEELENRKNARQSFLAFLTELESKGLLNEQSRLEKSLTLSLELMELPKKKNSMLIRMKLGQKDGQTDEQKDGQTDEQKDGQKNRQKNRQKDGSNKTYLIQNARSFCSALKARSEFTVRPRVSVHLSPESFDPSWQPLMERFLELANPCEGSNRSGWFSIPQSRVPAFLSLIPKTGQAEALFSANGIWDIVEEETPASVAMDSEGSLILTPRSSASNTGAEYIISGNQMAVLYPEHRRISLYRFADPLTSELFRYFISIPASDVRYISDLFVQKILPASSGLLQKSDRNEFRVTVHISLEKDSLLFQTQYWIGEEKKSPSFFEGKPVEQAMILACSSALRSLHAVENGTVSDPADVIFFLKSDLASLRQVASVYLDERLKQLNIRNSPSFHMQARRSRGWLNLSLHSSEYSDSELEEIYSAYRRKKNFILLKNDLILLSPESMAPVENLMEEAGTKQPLSDIRLPFFHIMLLSGYQDAGVEVDMDQHVIDAITSVTEYKSARLSLDEKLLRVLRPYQADGVRWMKRLSQQGFSGILADDMGLGKTLQVLAFVSQSGFDKPILVVCPKSLVYNWRNEIQKWLGDVPTEIIAGGKIARQQLIQSIPDKGRIFYITGYDSLRSDIDSYADRSFSLVLADEAQNIKNSTTQKAKAIRKIESGMRLALTGTPVENSLTDLWSIFDFLMPGYLGKESDFIHNYESESSPPEARTILAKKVAPFLLRRSKEEVLDNLPGKEIILVTVSMADEQRRLYESYLHNARELARTEKGISVFSALTRLRQICVDPSVFLENYDEMSAKISVALDQVVTSIEGGHRVLVFSSFTRVLEHFRYYLEERDIRSYYIHGETAGSARVEMAEKFNKGGKVNVMLVSIKAGGTGLNLVGADTVIHLDPWWNFAVEEQATDRAYRIGQTKPVTVYKLIAHDSIEEKVVALQEEKRQSSSDVVQTSLTGLDSLSPEDIQYILN